jgi:predicted HTH domain antitoxin
MIVIEDEVLQRVGINEDDLRMEIGTILYQKGTCSLRKAAKIVGVDWMELQGFLGDKGIYTYTEEMFQQDLETLKSFNK